MSAVQQICMCMFRKFRVDAMCYQFVKFNVISKIKTNSLLY